MGKSESDLGRAFPVKRGEGFQVNVTPRVSVEYIKRLVVRQEGTGLGKRASCAERFRFLGPLDAHPSVLVAQHLADGGGLVTDAHHDASDPLVREIVQDAVKEWTAVHRGDYFLSIRDDSL
jgi:hypothetical protein